MLRALKREALGTRPPWASGLHLVSSERLSGIQPTCIQPDKNRLMNPTFTRLQTILLRYATVSAQASAYPGWSDDFSRKQSRKVWDNDSDYPSITKQEILSLSKDERAHLGFQQWDESGLALIPIWAWNYLAKGTDLININGKKIDWSEKIDLDCRMGCLAFGVI